jgi:CheY-like chemotaxis protein
MVIVNDILDFSKIEAGKLAIEPVPFDLPEAVREVVDLLGPEAEKRHLTLATQLADGVPAATIGDPGRIRQVLLNLAGNAVKFTQEGQVTIEVGCRERSATEALIVVAVHDTGIGIPAETLGRLFQRFSQADAATTRKYGGTGLGLAISRRLVELMGGQIGVESKIGKGSTFWFTVPLRLAASNDARVAQATPSTAAQASRLRPADRGAVTPRLSAVPAQQVRLLLAEDNVVNQRVACRMLEKLGFRVDVVANGAEAVAAIGRIPYDLVFMDCQMPEMDGYQATQAIRRSETPDRHLPVIALTAAAMQGDRQRCLDAGMDDYLAKPVTRAALVETLQRWLDGHPANPLAAGSTVSGGPSAA